MNALLNAKFRDEDVKGCIQNTNDFGLAHNRAISLGQVGNEYAKEQMSRLFLGQIGGIPFAKESSATVGTSYTLKHLHVALLSNFSYSIAVHTELDIG